jgi:hypothetical protein
LLPVAAAKASIESQHDYHLQRAMAAVHSAMDFALMSVQPKAQG